MDPEKLTPKAENIDSKATATATYDLLKDDIDEKDLEKVEPKEDEKEKLDLDDDEKNEKEEVEEKETDDAELQIRIPRNKEILAKYPDLWKDFPHLKAALPKLQKFYEVFPSIQDANDAVEKIKSFEEFEKDITSGNLESTLKTVAEQDKDAFGRIVDNYLPNLQKVNPDAYYHVIGGVIKSTIVSMVNDAKNSNNDDLKAAASLLHQYVFGKTDWQPHTRYGPDNKEPDEKQKKFDDERNSYIEQRFNDAKTDLSGRVSNIIESSINDYIDPKGQMTDYVKKVAIRQVKESLDDIIENDSQFKKVIDNLWQRAGSENFNRGSLDKIKGAWLSKARVHLKDLIQKARKDALEGLGKRVREEKVQQETRTKTTSSKRSNDEENEPKKQYKRTVDYFLEE